MEFVLSGNALKTFAGAITCLASVGDKLVIQATSSQIVFQTVDALHTASQRITVKPDLFDDYTVPGSKLVNCSVSLKEICVVLEMPITNIKTLSVRLPNTSASKILWKLHFADGTKKSYQITCKVEPYVYHLTADRRNFPSDMIVRPRDLKKLLAVFQSSHQRITIIATDPNSFPAGSAIDIGGKGVGLRSYVDPTKDNDPSLPTLLWIDPVQEFVHYSHSGDPVDVTFAVKFLKAFVTFCKACDVNIHLYFDKAGKPILMAPEFGFDDGCSSNFDATLVLATIHRSQLHGGHTSEPSSGSAKNGMRRLPFYLMHFEHQKTLGIGCFGSVHSARHKLDKNLYAVKIIKFKTNNLDTTIREAEIMALLEHKHIARYHWVWTDYGLDKYCKEEKSGAEKDDGGENKAIEDDEVVAGNEEDKEKAGDDGYHFLCIQMTQYPSTLDERLTDETYTVNEELAMKWFRQMVEGVNYLHSLNIVHGDLKPKNMLIDANDNIRISDFGLAIKRNDAEPLLVGGFFPDKKDDIANLGQTLFRLFYPFKIAAKEEDIVSNMYSGIVKKAWRKKYPDQWALIRRLTSQNFDDRPSAQLLLEELMENEKNEGWY